jgi:hypothetical protein
VHQGAVLIGEEPSGAIPGRMLPLLELDLTTGQRFTASQISG